MARVNYSLPLIRIQSPCLGNSGQKLVWMRQGCKTDVNDAMWLAELLARGLIRELRTGPSDPRDADLAVHA